MSDCRGRGAALTPLLAERVSVKLMSEPSLVVCRLSVRTSIHSTTQQGRQALDTGDGMVSTAARDAPPAGPLLGGTPLAGGFALWGARGAAWLLWSARATVGPGCGDGPGDPIVEDPVVEVD